MGRKNTNTPTAIEHVCICYIRHLKAKGTVQLLKLKGLTLCADGQGWQGTPDLVQFRVLDLSDSTSGSGAERLVAGELILRCSYHGCRQHGSMWQHFLFNPHMSLQDCYRKNFIFVSLFTSCQSVWDRIHLAVDAGLNPAVFEANPPVHGSGGFRFRGSRLGSVHLSSISCFRLPSVGDSCHARGAGLIETVSVHLVILWTSWSSPPASFGSLR